jgi:hypothetical protein
MAAPNTLNAGGERVHCAQNVRYGYRCKDVFVRVHIVTAFQTSIAEIITCPQCFIIISALFFWRASSPAGEEPSSSGACLKELVRSWKHDPSMAMLAKQSRGGQCRSLLFFNIGKT